MCLILFAHQACHDLPLVLLANRDEYLARPTLPMAPWEEVPGLVAGRDLDAGGTWFGLGGNGRWAAVTNIREGERTSPGGPSRGALVRDYLSSTDYPGDFARRLTAASSGYAGFNLLLGTAAEVWYCNNRETAPQQLPPGLYGLSNGRLDAPWPKVTRGKAGLAALITTPQPTPEQGFRLLADREISLDHELPATGIPLAWERALSATFITTPNYGTRSSTVLLRSSRGAQWLAERTFAGAPDCWTQCGYQVASSSGMVA